MAQFYELQHIMKILHLTHPYHTQTGSYRILKELLDRIGTVDTHFVEPREFDLDLFMTLTENKPNLVVISMHEYLAIPFISQQIPVVIAPMFDGIGNYSSDFWSELEGVGVLNFSKLTHIFFKSLGFNSFHIRYFPALSEDFYGRNNSSNRGKLWVRSKEISPHLVWDKLHKNISLLDVRTGAEDYEIIYQSALLNPKIQYVHLPFSDSKEAYLNWLKEGTFFVAPRLYEGIGLSVLEAMSHGLIPVIHNSPTLTEYVKHNRTGLVCNFRNNKLIPISREIEFMKNNIELDFLQGRKIFQQKLELVDGFLLNNVEFSFSQSFKLQEAFNRFNYWRERNGAGKARYSASVLAKFPISYYALRHNL